jgi:outer membrane protein OmpA-like peptidoglycan-associated protein
LTRERAALIVSTLVSTGVSPERLHAAGYGARCPGDPACRQSPAPPACHAASQWDKDRRVVFKVLKVGQAPFSGEVACARASDLIPDDDRPFQR